MTFATINSERNLLCCYINRTSNIQIGRIASLGIEKIIFPGEKWLFLASPEASLELYEESLQPKQIISCAQLAC